MRPRSRRFQPRNSRSRDAHRNHTTRAGSRREDRGNGGQQINYTATAGTIVIKSEDDTPKASYFYVAYTKDDPDVSKRPVSFVYNGGPGAASLFTHMGDANFDATDMVFVDAIGTGYSRPAPGSTASFRTRTTSPILLSINHAQ